jgi:hypothetical protein
MPLGLETYPPWSMGLIALWSVFTSVEVFIVLRRVAQMRLGTAFASSFGILAGIAFVGWWVCFTEAKHEEPPHFPNLAERLGDWRTLYLQIIPAGLFFAITAASFHVQCKRHNEKLLVARAAAVRDRTIRTLMYFPASTFCAFLTVLMPNWHASLDYVMKSLDCGLLYVYCSLIMQHMGGWKQAQLCVDTLPPGKHLGTMPFLMWFRCWMKPVPFTAELTRGLRYLIIQSIVILQLVGLFSVAGIWYADVEATWPHTLLMLGALISIALAFQVPTSSRILLL